jgi:hypothetical protein
VLVSAERHVKVEEAAQRRRRIANAAIATFVANVVVATRV